AGPASRRRARGGGAPAPRGGRGSVRRPHLLLMRHGLCVANIGTYADPRAAARLARTAEDAGWEAFFVWDHLAFVWNGPAGDPWIVLAAVAGATSKLLIGTAITPVPRRRLQV